MKKLLSCILVTLSFYVTSSAQQKLETTTTPLKGTVIENGTLKISKGYKATISDDKKTVTISRRANGGVSGTYSCYCPGNTGRCDVVSDGVSVRCDSGTGIICIDNCQLITKGANESASAAKILVIKRN
jgi:hypothetical protein